MEMIIITKFLDISNLVHDSLVHNIKFIFLIIAYICLTKWLCGLFHVR